MRKKETGRVCVKLSYPPLQNLMSIKIGKGKEHKHSKQLVLGIAERRREKIHEEESIHGIESSSSTRTEYQNAAHASQFCCG